MKKIVLFMVTTLLFALVGCSSTDYSEKSSKVELDIGSNDDFKAEEQQKSDVATVVSSESTWAYDVTEPTVVLQNSDYFLKVRVKTKEKTKYFIKNAVMPASTYNLEVLEVLVNDDGNVPRNIKLAVNGGIVSMQEYVNTMDEETQKKTNTANLSQKELEENVLINDESYYELEQDMEYYIFVRDLTDDINYKGYYAMPEGGYDVFAEDNGQYTNVLTGRVLEIQD